MKNSDVNREKQHLQKNFHSLKKLPVEAISLPHVLIRTSPLKSKKERKNEVISNMKEWTYKRMKEKKAENLKS